MATVKNPSNILHDRFKLIIFEFGTMHVRVGISGETNPRHIIQIKSKSFFDKLNFVNPGWKNAIRSLIYNIYMYRLQVEPSSNSVVLLFTPLTPSIFTDTLFSILIEMSVPNVKVVHSGTLRCVPLAIGITLALVVDIGHLEARIGCVYQYERCDYPVLMDSSLQTVPCGYISFIRFLIQSWNRYHKSNWVKENEEGITIFRAFLSGKDTILINGNSLFMNRKLVKECLDEVYCNFLNPNSLVHAILITLLSSPIDLKCSFAKNIIFVGGGLVALNQCHLERRISNTVLKIYGSNSTKRENVTKSKFSSLKKVLFPSKKKSFSILYPLPFLESSISWIGASIFSTALLQKRRMMFEGNNICSNLREFLISHQMS